MTVVSTPWQRREDESPAAYAAFLRYRDAGPARKLRATKGRQKGDKKTSVAGRIQGYSTRHDWVARCAAWDDHIAQIESARYEDVAAETAETWARRREESREIGFTTARKAVLLVAARIDRMTAIDIGAVDQYELGRIVANLAVALGIEGSAINDAMIDLGPARRRAVVAPHEVVVEDSANSVVV